MTGQAKLSQEEPYIKPRWKLGEPEEGDYSEQIMGQRLWQPGAVLGQDGFNLGTLVRKQQGHWQKKIQRAERVGDGWSSGYEE